MFPRTVQLEHPEPCELETYHFPPASSAEYAVWLPSESVRLIDSVSVKMGPHTVLPAPSTETGPVEAPEGTVVVIEVSLQLVTVAVAPLTATVLLLCAGPKPVPVIVTVEPTGPVDGEAPVTVSDSSTVN